MSASVPVPIETLPHRTVAAGDVVFLEGQPADQAYVILKGEVQVMASGATVSHAVINRMSAGEMFGEVGLLRPGGTRTATIISEGGCVLIEINRSFFDQSLGKIDQLLRYVIDHLCERLVALSTRVADASES